MAMKGGYETLDVYQLAFELAVRIHNLTAELPKHEFFGGVVDQVRRSSKGICANIAEGLSKRQSEADEYKFLAIAIGSAEETRVWLAFCERLNYLGSEIVAGLRSDYERVCQMLYVLQQIRKKAA